jgi:hypothetical protein
MLFQWNSNDLRKEFLMPNQKAKEKGRPKLKWEDGVDNNVKSLGESDWKNPARNRQIWQNLLMKTMARKVVLPMMLILS